MLLIYFSGIFLLGDCMTLLELREKTTKLPGLPGVYLMKNKQKKIIYIGKAKDLKKRVSQYFRNVEKHQEKVRKMVENVDDFDYIITDSEFEALILECSLIKQNNPKYNILLKDDKGYSYIEISKGDWPKIKAVKQRKDPKNNTYIGPFMSGYTVVNTVDIVHNVFKLPTCTRKFPQEFGKQRPCLNFHINKCMGVCSGKISKEEYNKTVKDALEFIQKGSNEIVQTLKEKMEQASENLDFEVAAKYRDRLRAIEKIKENQKAVLHNPIDQDAIGFANKGETVVVVVLKFRKGLLADKEEFIFYEQESLEELREEFLSLFYLSGREIPSKIFVDSEFIDLQVTQEALEKQRGKKVEVIVPQRGENLKIVSMAVKNAIDKLDVLYQRPAKEVKVLEQLQEVLGLEKLPSYIESYDISNLGEDDTVCGMVVFKDGKPYKSAYKRFKIKTIQGQDDYGAMSEAISRRFARYKESDSDEGFGKLPDLILLDGGKGHVSTIAPLVKSFGVSVPVYGMVKDQKHKTKAISKDGKEVEIRNLKSVFQLITKIQDEVHRFSLQYQRTLSKKRNLHLSLTAIEGIGEKKAIELLHKFGSVAKVMAASEYELQQVKSITKKDAKVIINYFENQ